MTARPAPSPPPAVAMTPASSRAAPAAAAPPARSHQASRRSLLAEDREAPPGGPAAMPSVASSCSVYSTPFHCPLCLKAIRRSAVSPRLAHLASCAILNGVDIPRARELVQCSSEDWEAFTATQAAESSTATAAAAPAGKPPSGLSSLLAASAATTKKRKAAASKPLTLDSSLASTRAGSGVGTALAHVKQPRKSGKISVSSSSSSAATLATAAPVAGGTEAKWELENGIFLLGEHFVVPNPPPAQHTVAQLEKMSEATENPTAGSAAAAATSTPAAAASSQSSSSSASIAAQLYSWRHYVHEMDQVILQMETRRQWALVKYRLLQDRLASEGGATEEMHVDTDVTTEETPIDPTPAPSPSGTPSASSLWNKHGSSSSTLPASEFIGQLKLQNRRDAPYVPTPSAAPPVQLSGAPALPHSNVIAPPVLPQMPTAARSAPSPATPPQVAPPINIWAKASTTPARQNTQPPALPPALPSPPRSVALPNALDQLLLSSAFTQSAPPEPQMSQPALTQAVSYDASQSTPVRTQTAAHITPMQVEPPSLTGEPLSRASSHLPPMQSSAVSPSHHSAPTPVAATSVPAVSTPLIVLPVLVPESPAELTPAAITSHAVVAAAADRPPSPQSIPAAPVQPAESAHLVSTELTPPPVMPHHQPLSNSLPLPFALTPEDFMLTPEQPQSDVVKMGVEDAVDLVSPSRSQHAPASEPAVEPAASSSSALSQQPQIDVDVDMQERADVSICIPETPTHSHDVTAAVDTSAETIELEQTLAEPAVLLFVAADLLAAEGAEVAAADHDSLFSLSQPSLRDADGPEDCSQPGLEEPDEVMEERKECGNQQEAELILVEEVMHPFERVHERKAEATETSAADSMLIDDVLPAQERPDHFKAAAASTVKSAPSLLPQSTGLLSARAIIELLSDGEDDDSKHAPSTHVNSKARSKKHALDAMVDVEEEDDVLIVKVSPSLRKPSFSLSGYRSNGGTPTMESKSIFSSGASAASAASGTNGSAPASWQQPVSSRKLYERSLSVGAAAALPPPNPVSFAPPIAASSIPAPSIPPPAPPVPARLPSAIAAAQSAAIPSPRCTFALSDSASMLATFGACCMPAFDSFSLEDLKEVMATFGLKQKSKNQMSLKLQELWILMAKKHGNAAAAAASAPPPPPPKEKKPRKKKADAIDAAQAAAAAPSAVVARPSTPILLAHPIPAAAVAAAPVAAKAESEAKSKKRKVASSSSASVIARNEDYAAHILEEDSPAHPAAKELIGGIPASTAFQIRAFLRSQADIYMRILLFQPLELGDLAFVLQEVGGIQLNPFALRGFLDQEGVVTQAKQDQGNRGAASGDRKPKKGGMHKPRAKRARR